MAYKAKKIDSFQMSENAHTKITEMGNVIELTVMQKKPVEPPTRKLDKDTYVNIHTGEVGYYEHINNRSESSDSIRHTLSNIRALINCNCSEIEKVKWLTFTYAENMRDTQRLYQDFKKFWLRFKYWCKKNNVSVPEYISVIEPQSRGAWHIHAFFIFPHTAPFIHNDVIAKLWGQGFTKTKACNDCDNIGAYFSAYLADMPLDEYELPLSRKANVIEKSLDDDENKKSKSKKFVKGGRLHLYPSGMNILRHSKNIKYPLVSYDTRINAEKKVCSAQQTFSSTFEIVNVVSDDVVNVIQKNYYNTKRKKKKEVLKNEKF